MKILKWTKDLSVNNAVIDNQHKELFELTNTLITNSNIDVNSPLVGETLRDLLNYTKKHFRDEEKLLENLNYPGLKEHRKMHVDFIQKIAFFAKDVMEKKDTITKEMIEYLADWLLNHTSTEDLDFKKYINKS